MCTYKDLSFYEILKLPDDGFMIDASSSASIFSVPRTHFHLDNVECIGENSVLCKIYSMRTFLPDPTTFLAASSRAKKSGCDTQFSNLMSMWIKTYSKIESKPGHPCDSWGDKVSVGKYLRYAASMQYSLFKGFSNDTLIDFNYEDTPLGWPWTDKVQNCSREFRGWNCAFERFNSKTSLNEPFFKGLLKMEDIFSYRRSKPNHVIQLLFFGKLVSTIAEPSALAQTFFTDNIVSINDHIWTHRHTKSTFSKIPRERQFSSYQEFVTVASTDHTTVRPIGNKVYTSVSMHVRRGDSCDIDLDVEIDIDAAEDGEGLVKDGVNRPCYNVTVYMAKLHYLRRIYNVRRVFLSTDSVEMIERTKIEPLFNWVYLRNNREVFSKGHGWVEKRPDEDNEHTMMSAVADLNLMRYGDMFLGAFSSHYSKLAYYMICGHSMRIPPFVSLDVPLPCTPFMDCSETWFKQHTNLTMQWMFDLIG